uniref:GHMP kinase N-terminal domain-containing protein n=1 Tax=Panagrolaimus davidi TaxID=227884 RepID=A0A914R5D2_9BILA
MDLGQKLYDKAPEILSRSAKEYLKKYLDSEDFENREKHGNCSNENNHKLMLQKVEFLFEISKSKEETDFAVKAAIKWAKNVFEERKDREKAAFEIGNILNHLAISASMQNLPSECSCKLNFPLILPPSPTPFKILPKRVRVKVAGRMDIAGGWTDTPPITYELKSPHVLNAAINVDGEKPIKAEIYPLDHLSGLWISTGEGTLRCFETKNEIIENAQKPSESCSLICAVIVASGILEKLESKKWSKDTASFCAKSKQLQFESGDIKFGGLFIQCHSNLPHGSGLGTSSILSGAVLAGLWTLFCKKFSNDDIIKGVLKVEQYHTTGGGWQDQLGGIIPGIKLGALSSNHSVTYRILPLPKPFEESLNQRLFLIYTGKTRLAKNLLQTVLLNWIQRDLDIVLAFEKLASEAETAAEQITAGIFPCEIAESYHEIKKKLAIGSEPIFVGDLIKDLKSAGIVEAAWIAGAGGGGFLYVYLKENISRADLENHISNFLEYSLLKVSSVKIDNNPMEIEIH